MGLSPNASVGGIEDVGISPFIDNFSLRAGRVPVLVYIILVVPSPVGDFCGFNADKSS
jgi:hypothetical protein